MNASHNISLGKDGRTTAQGIQPLDGVSKVISAETLNDERKQKKIITEILHEIISHKTV